MPEKTHVGGRYVGSGVHGRRGRGFEDCSVSWSGLEGRDRRVRISTFSRGAVSPPRLTCARARTLSMHPSSPLHDQAPRFDLERESLFITLTMSSASKKYAADFLSFVNASPTRMALPRSSSDAKFMTYSFPRCRVRQTAPSEGRLYRNQCRIFFNWVHLEQWKSLWLTRWLGTELVGKGCQERRPVLPHT